MSRYEDRKWCKCADPLNGWKSIKDFPPPNGWLIIAYRYYADPEVLCSGFCLHQDGVFRDFNLNNNLIRDAVFWMFLPEPPKENT